MRHRRCSEIRGSTLVPASSHTVNVVWKGNIVRGRRRAAAMAARGWGDSRCTQGSAKTGVEGSPKALFRVDAVSVVYALAFIS